MTWIVEPSGATPWGHPLCVVRYRHGTIGGEPHFPTPALLPRLAQDNPRFGPLSEANASRLALLLNDLDAALAGVPHRRPYGARMGLDGG